MHRRRGPPTAALFVFTLHRLKPSYGHHGRRRSSTRPCATASRPPATAFPPRRSFDSPGSSTRSAWTSWRPDSRPRPRATTGACGRSPRSSRRPVVAALARCHERDIELAGEAIRPAARGGSTSSSPRPISTSRRSSGRPATRCSTAPAPPSARRGSTPTTWSSPPRTPAGPTPTFSAGSSSWPSPKAPRTVNLPDTVGYATPGEYAAMFRDVRAPGARGPTASC